MHIKHCGLGGPATHCWKQSWTTQATRSPQHAAHGVEIKSVIFMQAAAHEDTFGAIAHCRAQTTVTLLSAP
jgi:hypothetical protein